MALPGRATSARPPPPKAEAPVRAELKEFEKFQEAKPGSRKTALVVVLLALAAAIVYVVFFALPRTTEIDGRATNIPGVVRVELGENAARVIVSDAFVEKPEPALSQLISFLREKKIAAAVLSTTSGAPAGQINVKTGLTVGIPGPKKQEVPPPTRNPVPR
jgi:hypothetical protein